jgi:hypothetical protein
MTDGVVRADKKILLDEALKIAPQDPIWASRGRAIQSYAILEQALCSLLSELGGMTSVIATIVFYKITNSDARNKILENLLHVKHGKKYNLFWNAYFQELRRIDIKRNEIVHWLSAMNAAINTQDMMIVGITLVHPASLNRKGAPPTQLTSSDLIAFATKCDVFARLSNMFRAVSSGEVNGDEAKPWLDIFQQPLVYPLRADHLLLTQSAPRRDSQPQS